MLKSILAVISSSGVMGVVGVFWKGLLAVQQSNISLTMLSHEEQKRYRSIMLMWLIVGFFVLSFAGGIGGSMFHSLISAHNYPATTSANPVKPVDISNDSVVDGIIWMVFLLLFIAALVCVLLIRKKESSNPLYTDLCKWDRYFALTVFTFLSFSLLPLNVIAGIAVDHSRALYYNLGLSFAFAFAAGITVNMMTVDCYKDMAFMKAYFNNRLVYLFHMDNDILIAGDHLFADKCDSIFMIPKEEVLELQLSPIRKNDEVYLRRKNVDVTWTTCECGNYSTVLRTVIKDWKDKSKDKSTGPTFDSSIRCVVNEKSKTIEYSIDGRDNEKCELKVLEIEKWPQNVLLF